MRWSRATTPTIDDGQALSELKTYLRIAGDYADDELMKQLHRSIDDLEGRSRRQLLTAEIVYRFDRFPWSGCIELPRAPLQSVTSITYTDSLSVSQTWASTEYDVIADSEPGLVRLAHEKKLPTNSPRDIVITYNAGYGAGWNDLPGQVQECLLYMVGQRYYQRNSDREAGAISDCIEAIGLGDDFTKWL